MYGPCTERKVINRNYSWENLDVGLTRPRFHIKYFKYVPKSKENHENDVSPNREYRLRDRNYNKESNVNAGVENYKTEIKISLGRLNSTFKQTEERISKCENGLIEIIQSEVQKEKKKEEKWTA